jgi:hypothetical protein
MAFIGVVFCPFAWGAEVGWPRLSYGFPFSSTQHKGGVTNRLKMQPLHLNPSP